MVRTAWYVIVWEEALRTGKKASKAAEFRIRGVGQCSLGDGRAKVLVCKANAAWAGSHFAWKM